MSIQARFDKAVEIIGALPKDGPVKPSQDDQLFFYAHFKQANIGDCNTSKPGMMDFTGKYKWNAWNDIKGTTQESAKEKYVEHFIAMLKKSPGEDSEKYIAQIDEAGKAAST